MHSWLQPLERWLVRLEDTFGAVAIAVLVGCGALICVDVAMRYVFNHPILGGIEIVEYALVYITFLGASWAVPRGAHIDIDVAVQAMPKFWQRICALLSNLISLGVAVVLTVFGVTATWTAFVRGAFKPTVLEVPTWIVLVIIPIGSAVLALRFLREVIVCADAVATGQDIVRSDEQHRPTVE
jgi:TRAP-type C4-dicarboxylate transport system permease small subunit